MDHWEKWKGGLCPGSPGCAGEDELMAWELTEAACPPLSPSLTRSGRCSCSFLMTGSLVSAELKLSSGAACLGPRSRMSRTEKLDVLFGILMDNNLDNTYLHSFHSISVEISLLLNEVKTLGVLLKGRLLVVGVHMAPGVLLLGDRLSGVGGRDPGCLIRHEA